MKRLFLIITLIATIGFEAKGQSNPQDYLDMAKEKLEAGDCAAAQRNYNVYKELTGSRNITLEEAINRCKQDKTAVSKYVPKGYVDLGLPSGTLWKASNEDGFYTFKDAVKKFGTKLPTSDQFDELVNNCTWKWYGAGFKVIGKNGNYIMFSAAGSKTKNKGYVDGTGTHGTYWTSESWRTDNNDAVVFGISNDYGGTHFCYRHSKSHGFTVRLVYNK